MMQQMVPTAFYLQTKYLQDIKSNQVYSKVHIQPNWAPGAFSMQIHFHGLLLKIAEIVEIATLGANSLGF